MQHTKSLVIGITICKCIFLCQTPRENNLILGSFLWVSEIKNTFANSNAYNWAFSVLNFYTDKNTNVLAFVNDDESKEQTQEFGDIAICYPYLEKEAASQGKSINDHISHMLIHGILHIFGHDHIKTTQRKDMEKEEIRILKKLKIGDPYLI